MNAKIPVFIIIFIITFSFNTGFSSFSFTIIPTFFQTNIIYSNIIDIVQILPLILDLIAYKNSIECFQVFYLLKINEFFLTYPSKIQEVKVFRLKTMRNQKKYLLND